MRCRVGCKLSRGIKEGEEDTHEISIMGKAESLVQRRTCHRKTQDKTAATGIRASQKSQGTIGGMLYLIYFQDIQIYNGCIGSNIPIRLVFKLDFTWIGSVKGHVNQYMMQDQECSHFQGIDLIDRLA